MFAFDLVADPVGEETADHGRHRRHQENAADDDAEPAASESSHAIAAPAYARADRTSVSTEALPAPTR